MSSPDQEQDNDTVQDISILSADLRRQTAALVEHSSLPALRLVSRGWNEAANLAVRRLECELSAAQLRLVGQRWPNLEQLALEWRIPPDKNSRDLLSSLRPLKQVQHLGMGNGAALLPEGQELMLRQTRLLSLRVFGIFDIASDGLLQVIGRLSHLERLDCGLQAERRVLKALQPPLQLEAATDRGVRCLSSLQSLQALALTFRSPRLPVRKSTVTGQALSAIGSLHQLTHLYLDGWPMVDTDLGHLKGLQLHSLELSNCLRLTSGCLVHLNLLTSLRTLSISSLEPPWRTDEELDAFEELAHKLMPFLTTLSF